MFFLSRINSQVNSCNTSLKIPDESSAVLIGKLDVSGDQITVEATFTRTQPYSGGRLFAGDLVSKHAAYTDVNYLLRPNSAEITTANGYFLTPQICDIQLNKMYHAAMVYDGKTLKFYRNGFLMSQVAATGDLFLNNWITTIGNLASNPTGVKREALLGFINNVRIWNVARTQQQIQQYMYTPLPFPATQAGLLADYTFNTLTNQQGNTAWNGSLYGNAALNQSNPSCKSFLADSCGIVVACKVNPDFSFTQDICNPLSVQFANETQYAISAFWYFGNGIVSNSLNPSVTYSSYGADTVKLLVQTANGCIDTISKIIPVNLNQDDSLITMGDTTVCGSSSIQLNALQGVNYCWTPNTGLSATNISNPVASISTTTTFHLNAQVLDSNLIVNGNFSQGNTGFKSSYLYNSSGLPAGVYFVGTNPSTWNPGMPPCTDHTSGNGNMMLVNGATQTGVNIWSETVSVKPNTNYAFATWVESISGANPAQLQFFINGNPVGNIFMANAATCLWDEFYCNWNSGTAAIAVIAIVNMNPAFNGNDFALDDISFAEASIKTDSVTIKVSSIPVINISRDTAICAGGSAQLTATALPNGTYSWIPATGLNDTSVANPVASPTATTIYFVTATGADQCTASDSVSITVNPQPVFSITPLNTNICSGDTAVLTASGGDLYQWYPSTYTTDTAAAAIGVYPAFTATYYTIITNSTCKATDTLSATINVSQHFNVGITKSNDIDCIIGQANLQVTGSGTQFGWTPAININDPNIPNPVVSPFATTTYYVTVHNGTSCVQTDSITVRVLTNDAQNGYLLASAFTPNGDGVNDCFGVRLWGGVRSIDFSVYSRWGIRIFHTNNPSDCWDGTYKGVKQPPGTFIYQIKATTICGNVYRKGTVVLIR